MLAEELQLRFGQFAEQAFGHVGKQLSLFTHHQNPFTEAQDPWR
jgi:hypothetical protein